MVGKVRKGTAVCGLVGRGKAVKAGHGWARFGRARLGAAVGAGHGKAGLGSARPGVARQGRAWQGMAVKFRSGMLWIG